MIYTFNYVAFLGPLGGPELFLILLIGMIAVLPFWFICKKAGFSPWLSLLMLVPFGAIILPFILAFSPWKIPESALGKS